MSWNANLKLSHAMKGKGPCSLGEPSMGYTQKIHYWRIIPEGRPAGTSDDWDDSTFTGSIFLVSCSFGIGGFGGAFFNILFGCAFFRILLTSFGLLGWSKKSVGRESKCKKMRDRFENSVV